MRVFSVPSRRIYLDKKNANKGGKSAVELAILNGIEAYNREQAKKSNGTKERDNTSSEEKNGQVSLGKLRTGEAMEEAGLKNHRRSRAKGRGTKVAFPGSPRAEKEAPPIEKKKHPAPQEPQKKKGKRKPPVKVLFFGGVGEIGKNKIGRAHV